MQMPASRTGRAALLAGMLVLSSDAALAQSSPIRLEASALLGSTTPERGGWRSVLVRLENPSNESMHGTIEIESRVPWMRGSEALQTSIPFSLVAGARSVIEAPTRSFAGGDSAFRVRALDSDGRVLTETALPALHPSDALVLHLRSPSRVAPQLRGMPFVSRRSPLYGGRPRTCAIGVSSAPIHEKSGDLLLPQRAAGYGEASLVLGSGRDLPRLGDAERAALASWVLSGGALALSLDRPEDLKNPTLRALLGGEPERSDAPQGLAESTVFVVPPEDATANPSSPTPPTTLRLSPSPATERKLAGFRGANLRTTAWGAAASYGLGEVHLLAFDPEDPDVLSDPWARYKLADLIRHTFDREPQAVLRQSGRSPESLVVDGVRRELDPNQTTRWTIVVSAIVLLLYAVLAGPLNFYLAARKGRPLEALLRVPLWSAITLAIVVLLGVMGKGVSGRARKLALVEAGAGMTRGAALHFRGFYAASSRELMVRAFKREHVLDLAGFASDMQRKLVVDRDGPRLTGLRTKPWQTVLIREEGFFDLADGISMVPHASDLLIRNRASQDLIGVVVKPVVGDTRYFSRIRDGESVALSRGRPLGTSGHPGAPRGMLVPLGSDAFASTLDADFPGLGRAWRALEPATGGGSEWWPEDVPVLIGALDGGQGKLTDSGLAVEYDRLLVRVVGTGGVP